MEKKELKERLKSYEGNINAIPLSINPCKMCKVYKKKDCWDSGDRLVNNEWRKGICDNCCWFYDSKFEVNV